MAKEFTLSTGKLPLGGLPRNSVVVIIDCPDITSAVNRGRNAINQQTQKNKCAYKWLILAFVLLQQIQYVT